MIVIVDYGLGNLGSILNKLERIGIRAIISSENEDIENAEKLILPGVGSFITGMKNLEKNDLIAILNRKVIQEKTPILGICLGMQLFSKWSQEGNVEGLGWIDAETIRFDFEKNNLKLKIPHMGMNAIKMKIDDQHLVGINNGSKFYFVHSYHVNCNDENNVIGITNYGYDFVSVMQKENILGIQCHPEKSHKSGIQFLKFFVEEF